MAMHISNLFKLNNLIKSVDFEKISLSELKEHYVRIKSFKNDQKILSKLPDKGDKYLKRLQNIEEVIVKRCAELENKEKTEVKQETDLTDLLDKFQNILIERKRILLCRQGLDGLVPEEVRRNHPSRQMSVFLTW